MNFTMKQWRLLKGLTQEEMAKRCHVHRTTYVSWEANPEKITIGNARLIAAALGESVDTIFFAGDSTKRSNAGVERS